MDCTVVLVEGDDGAPVSHGLCQGCFTIRMNALGLADPLIAKPRVA
jgi:hypothetical protein